MWTNNSPLWGLCPCCSCCRRGLFCILVMSRHVPATSVVSGQTMWAGHSPLWVFPLVAQAADALVGLLVAPRRVLTPSPSPFVLVALRVGIHRRWRHAVIACCLRGGRSRPTLGSSACASKRTWELRTRGGSWYDTETQRLRAMVRLKPP